MNPVQRLALGVILIQGGHVVEHVVQTAQVYGFGVPRSHAHGVLGAVFDLEWVHVVYNTVFLAALYAVFHAQGARIRVASRGPIWSMFTAGLVLQVYHEVEHLVKIYQHVALGRTPAPGILGNLVDLVVLHLAFNLIVLVLVLPLLLRRIGKVRLVHGLGARGPARLRPSPSWPEH